MFFIMCVLRLYKQKVCNINIGQIFHLNISCYILFYCKYVEDLHTKNIPCPMVITELLYVIVFDGDKVGRNCSCTYMANLTLRIVTILKIFPSPLKPHSSFYILSRKIGVVRADANVAILVNIVLRQHIAYIKKIEANNDISSYFLPLIYPQLVQNMCK